MSVNLTKRIPPGSGLRRSSGAFHGAGSVGALDSGGGPPQSKTRSRSPHAPSERPPSRIPHHALPRISPLLLHWFTWYCRRYIRRHFHSLRVSRDALPPEARGLPLVVFTNHASWWDPLVGLVLKEAFFPERQLFAPMDAAMLERYRLFARLGFFGVEQQTRRGAVRFLHSSEAILRRQNSLLAVTPQGRFADARERPVRFQPGLGHLAARAGRAVFLPMVTEFVFWEERLPEILVRFGEPVEVRSAQAAAFTPQYWTSLFEQRLESAQDALSGEAQSRDPANFECVLRGGAGQGGIYDWWRAWRSWRHGEAFNPEHGGK